MTGILETLRRRKHAGWLGLLPILVLLWPTFYGGAGQRERPPTLAIRPPVANDDECVVIPLSHDAPSSCIILIGNLDDAGTTRKITLTYRRETARSTSRGMSLMPQHGRGFVGDHAEAGPVAPTGEARSRSVSKAAATNPTPRAPRQFFIQTGSPPEVEASYQPVTANVVAESAEVRVWSDAIESRDDRCEFATWLAGSVQTEVLPAIRNLYGDIEDVDGDGKLSVCLTALIDQLPKAETPVEGLVQANDFSRGLPRPFGNGADVIFLSPRLRPGSHCRTILLHEAAHLAVFSRRRSDSASELRPEDEWIHEGLAHFAEAACGGDWSNLDHRLVAFANHPADAGLIVTDARRQRLWRHAGSRGASYLFLAWLADEYGSELIGELPRHPQAGCAKLESLVGEPFPDLFRRWSIAVGRATLREAASSDRNEPDDSQFGSALRRAGVPNVMAVGPHGTTRSSLLRGTAIQAVRPERGVESECGSLLLRAPGAARLQITVLERRRDGDVARIVR